MALGTRREFLAPLLHRRRRTTMMRRPLVGGADLEQPPIGPHAAEQGYACRVATAEEAGEHGHLWQTSDGALLACARLRAVTHQATFVRVRTRLIGRIQQRIELLAVHQVDEDLPERFAAGDEL